MGNCSEPFGNISLHVLAWRHFIYLFFFLVTSVSISMMLDGVTSFSRIKILQKHVNASVTVKVLDGISCHVVAENWQHLNRKLAFSSVLVC